MVQNYELTYLISPEVNGKVVGELTQKIEKLVSESNQVKHFAGPEKIKLAYPIQKKGEASLATLEFQVEPQKMEKLKEVLKKTPEIMRFLLVKKEKTLKAKLEKPTIEKLPKKQEKVSPTPKVGLEEIEKDLEKILDFPHEDKVKPQSA